MELPVDGECFTHILPIEMSNWPQNQDSVYIKNLKFSAKAVQTFSSASRSYQHLICLAIVYLQERLKDREFDVV